MPTPSSPTLVKRSIYSWVEHGPFPFMMAIVGGLVWDRLAIYGSHPSMIAIGMWRCRSHKISPIKAFCLTTRFVDVQMVPIYMSVLECLKTHITSFDMMKTFKLLGSSRYEQGQPPHANNDIPAICGTEFQGFGIAEQQGLRDFFVDVDENAAPMEPVELENSPRMTGSGMTEIDGELIVVGMDPGPDLSISVYDTDLQLDRTGFYPAIWRHHLALLVQ